MSWPSWAACTTATGWPSASTRCPGGESCWTPSRMLLRSWDNQTPGCGYNISTWNMIEPSFHPSMCIIDYNCIYNYMYIYIDWISSNPKTIEHINSHYFIVFCSQSSTFVGFLLYPRFIWISWTKLCRTRVPASPTSTCRTAVVRWSWQAIGLLRLYSVGLAATGTVELDDLDPQQVGCWVGYSSWGKLPFWFFSGESLQNW